MHYYAQYSAIRPHTPRYRIGMRAYECLSSGFPGIYALRLSEKSRPRLQRSLTGHRNSTFRPILAFVFRPSLRSKGCSYPFSDSLSETVRKYSWTCKPPHHEPCHSHVDERLSRRAQSLVVFGHASVVRDPRERTLCHPTARQPLETRSRRQLVPIHLAPFLEPLPRPYSQNLLGRRFRGAVYDLDLHVECLLHPLFTSAPVTCVHPQVRKAW